MTKRTPCPPAPGPLEDYAERFDELFGTLAQRRGFREYLTGLLLPRDRNKTLTSLTGAEPIVDAQAAPVQSLQFFLSESNWDMESVNTHRLQMLWDDPRTTPHEDGVLVIDETGDRKDGKHTAHVANQYLGSIGKIANGIVSVSSVWADERVYHPLHIEPYEPASRLPGGKKDPAFRTKPQLAVRLVDRALEAGISFRAVVADSVYGQNATFEGELWAAGLPYVMSIRPSRGTWAPAEDAHTPRDAAERLEWRSPEEPGDWTAVERRFRDGHTERWWAADLALVGYGPDQSTRLVAATTDPERLPAASTWYVLTNLPLPGTPHAEESAFEPADLAEVVRLYGLRMWVEQSYKQVKGALGFADFQVRADHAIRRHWHLVFCAFSFCWWAYVVARNKRDTVAVDPVPKAQPAIEIPEAVGEKRRGRRGKPAPVMAGGAQRSAELVGSVDHALALLASVVEFAPADRAASAA